MEAGARLELIGGGRAVRPRCPLSYWHFFDAYLARICAVYRGNGIPLPGASAAEFIQILAVFRMIDDDRGTGLQISVLRDGERSPLYCCH